MSWFEDTVINYEPDYFDMTIDIGEDGVFRNGILEDLLDEEYELEIDLDFLEGELYADPSTDRDEPR